MRIVVAPANIGLAAARNVGVALAKGKYLLPLDADDLIDRRFLQVAVDALENNPEFDVVVSQAGYFETEADIPQPGETRDFRGYAVFVGEPLVSGVRENRFSTATALFRTDILRRNRYCESLRAYEDWSLYLRLAQSGVRFLVMTDVYFCYRSRPGSMVTADRDPAQKALFMHDMLRNAVEVEKLSPLTYLALQSPPPPPVVEIQIVREEVIKEVEREVVREVWPLPISRMALKTLFTAAAKHEIRLYQIKRFFTYWRRRSRQRYQAKLRAWKNVRKALRDWM
jgi:glycosyltransferase involved in cell wall biosynthesis